jgi:hypothetical protein
VKPSLPTARRSTVLVAALAVYEKEPDAVERGYPRFEWWVLDWNTPAQGFYESLGAAPQDEWTVWRTDGAALTVANSRPDAIADAQHRRDDHQRPERRGERHE